MSLSLSLYHRYCALCSHCSELSSLAGEVGKWRGPRQATHDLRPKNEDEADADDARAEEVQMETEDWQKEVLKAITGGREGGGLWVGRVA